MLTVVARSVFEDGEYYPQVFWDQCLYELKKCYSMKELMFQKKLTLTNQTNQKNLCFAIIGILRILVINLNHIFVMHAWLIIDGLWFKWFHDFKYKGVDYSFLCVTRVLN